MGVKLQGAQSKAGSRRGHSLPEDKYEPRETCFKPLVKVAFGSKDREQIRTWSIEMGTSMIEVIHEIVEFAKQRGFPEG